MPEQAPTSLTDPWRLALESTGAGVWDWNLQTNAQNHSARWETMLGYAPGELSRGHADFTERLHPDDRGRLDRVLADYLAGRCPRYEVEVRLRCKDGRWKWVWSAGSLVAYDDQQRPLRMIGVHFDIDAQVLARQQLLESEQRWKLAFEVTGDGVWDWHIASGREHCSPGLLAAYGYAPGELADDPQALNDLTHPDDLGPMQQALQDHLQGRTASYVNEHRIRCKDGHWKWILSRGTIIERDTQGQPVRMIGTHTDISQRKRTEDQIWQQANMDTLTNLPNRRLLRERLDQAIARARRAQSQLAVLFLDLDRFKEVNDTLGHEQGDRLLAEAALRISACVRATDTVARMGGDEFALLIGDVDDPQTLAPVLNKLLATLNRAFLLRDEQVYVSASIGVTLYPTDADNADDLLRQADQALYVAKGAGRNRYRFFTPDLQEAVQARVQLTADLRTALAQSQFRVVYQPIVHLATGAVHKAEVLVRWQHPERGLISPAQFIPVAETSGLIVPLGEWVFQQAAQQVAQWRLRLHPSFQISINKSPVQFENPDPRHGRWPDHLRARALAGDAIVVEITEGLLLSDSDDVIKELLQLSDDGIQVSLDDFGTGYSSLAYLQKFSVDFVKIDQSFVRGLTPGSTNQALCRAIIAMAHGLGMRVIAEGVETALQRDLLAAEDCDFGQGYYFSRPVDADAFEQWVLARPSTQPGVG